MGVAFEVTIAVEMVKRDGQIGASGRKDGKTRGKSSGKNLLRFSGVGVRTYKLSMMSLKDRGPVSFNCGSVSERGAYSARALR